MASPLMNNEYGSLSPRERVRDKLKSSICCFRMPPQGDATVIDQLDDMKSRTPRSSYNWLKSTAHELEIKDKCKSLISRIGKGAAPSRRHHGSGDFSYDPMSYALNFEDESTRADELSMLNFSSRLPATPDRPSDQASCKNPESVTREMMIVA